MDAPWHPVTDVGGTLAASIAADPGGTLLVFDFDGTLAPIVERATDSRMYEPAAEVIARLAPHVLGIAIVTGRAVDVVRDLGQLDERPGFERVQVFGQYGVERWDAATGTFDAPPVTESVPRAFDDLASLLASRRTDGVDVDGIVLEDKQRAIGVHYRLSAVRDEVASWLPPAAADIAERHGLEVEPGRLVVELRASTTTKGDAIRTLVAERSPRVVVMAGDDLGDVPAFEAVWAARDDGVLGANVVSGSDEAGAVQQWADVLCSGPEGVAAWLGEVADRLDGRLG